MDKYLPPIRSLRPTGRIFTASVVLGTCLAVTSFTPQLATAQSEARGPAVEESHGGGHDDYRLFYDKLSDGGSWLQTEQYGYVFQPQAAQGHDWRPYTDGYWVETDAGWTWVSNEPFGWATYHYGRWVNLVDTGWVWVPGAEWAPAYVSWRISKDHKTVGWAPLPPEAHISQTIGVERWVDSAYDIGPDAYVFIETTNIGEPSYRGHLLPTERVTTVFTETENVTSVTYRTVANRSVVYVGGPDVTVIRQVTGRPVRHLQLDFQERPVDYFVRGDSRSIVNVSGDRLVVAAAAPEVIRSTSIQVTQPRNARRLTTVQVDRGYRGVRDPQEVERIRASIRSQAPNVPAEVERQTASIRERDNRREANPPAGGAGNNLPPPANNNAAAAPPPAAPQPGAAGREAVNPPPSPSARAGASPTTRERSSATPAAEQRSPAAAASPHSSPAAASPTPSSAEPSRGRNNRREAEPQTTPSARPEASATPHRETTPHEATPRPSASPREEQRSQREEQRREHASPTPAERGESRAHSTPAERSPEATPRRSEGGAGENREGAASRQERPRPEATPARQQSEENRNEGASRRENPPASSRSEKGEESKAKPTPQP